VLQLPEPPQPPPLLPLTLQLLDALVLLLLGALQPSFAADKETMGLSCAAYLQEG